MDTKTLKIRIALILLTAFCTVTLNSQNARIKIDIDRTIGQVDKNLYGNFVEHLGRCVYGGIYEPGSPLSDEQGFRKDVLEAVKGLNVSHVRYPGGNFVSNYHRIDGVGPANERAPRMELAWARLEPNTYGWLLANGSPQCRGLQQEGTRGSQADEAYFTRY